MPHEWLHLPAFRLPRSPFSHNLEPQMARAGPDPDVRFRVIGLGLVATSIILIGTVTLAAAASACNNQGLAQSVLLHAAHRHGRTARVAQISDQAGGSAAQPGRALYRQPG